MTDSTESLRALTQHVLDSTSLSDPREIAIVVLRRLDDGDLRDALRETLPSWLRATFGQRRMLSGPLPPVVVPRQGVSRVDLLRNAWQRRLNTPLKVVDRWKRLGDCTRADLLDVAADLRGRAQNMELKADYYQRLAEHVAPGATVSSLPADPTELGAAA